MIPDPVLRGLFQAESDEHLQRLDEVLLRLEREPGDSALLEEAFREAHSMKGAARMLGLGAIQVQAHRLEDRLNQARQRRLTLDAAAISAMLADVASLRGEVAAAVGTGCAAAGPPGAAVPAPAPAVAPAPAEPRAEPAVPPAPSFPAPVLQIESVRVDTRRLDRLLAQAGELLVVRHRMSHRRADIDALMDHLRVLPDAPGTSGVQAMVQGLARTHAEDLDHLEAVSASLEADIRAARLLPVSTLFRLFPRMVRDLAEEHGKLVELVLEGEETSADKRILEELKDPLMHLLRNAVDHGIEVPERRVAAGKAPVGRITLRAGLSGEHIAVELADDGGGLDLDAIRRTAVERGMVDADQAAAMTADAAAELVLSAGFSTRRFVTDLSGRGVGLDVVRNNVERLKGRIGIRSETGHGTRFSLRLPVQLATQRILVLAVGPYRYGLPMDAVRQCRNVPPAEILSLAGRPTLLHRGLPVPVAPLAGLLGAADIPVDSLRPVVFLEVAEGGFALVADAVEDELEVVLKPMFAPLQGSGMVSGAAVLSSGDLCMVLEPSRLFAAIPRGTGAVRPLPAAGAAAGAPRKRILLAEDSLVTRAQEVRILEGAGYEVVAAVDGIDAFDKLATGRFDALVSDINMPRLDGLQLAERVRGLPRFAQMPIILVTSLASDADKQRGLEIGANAYITKPEFDQSLLLDCLERLIG